MAFDIKSFMQTQYAPRTALVDVPSLKLFFGTDKAIWEVRGQTAAEIAKANEASVKRKNIDAIIQAIASNQDQINELRKAIGVVDKDQPADLIKRLEMLTQCSVNPQITLDVAVKLAEVSPIEFFVLTNKIMELTGQGMEPSLKKPVSSGKTAKSKE